MKSILTQIPKLIELTLDKVSQVESPSERPEVAEAKKKLIKDIRGATKELLALSEKYANNEPNLVNSNKNWEELRVHLIKPTKVEQLSFDFMEPK